MTAEFYNFSKRRNSTKTPSVAGTQKTIVLKENTSMISPSIILSGHDFSYNYVYITEFGRYYFVNDIVVLDNNMSQYNLVEDVLASNITAIGNTVAHIAYSSTGWDKDLTDARIAVKGTKNIYHDTQALGFDSYGCYIIGVVNNQSDAKLGALSYYAMYPSELNKLINYFMDSGFLNEMQQYFNGNSMDFIQSCIWVPVNPTPFCGTMRLNFYLGDTLVCSDYSQVPPTPAAINSYPVTSPIQQLGLTVSVSLGSKYLDFRDAEPYTSASLYLPGVGLTDLNASDFYSSANVNIQTIFDITTGDCTYKIYDDSNQLLKTVSFNAAASVSLSQVNTNIGGALAAIGGTTSGLIGTAGSAVSLNPMGVLASGVGTLASASAGIMAANHRSASIKGNNSGRSGFYTNTASTIVVRQYTEDPDDANYIAKVGRPVGKTHAISNHSGYVQCEAASVSIAGDNIERDEINSLLNSGIYYE